MRELAIIFAINLGIWSSIFWLIRKTSQLSPRLVEKSKNEIISNQTAKASQMAQILSVIYILFILVYFLTSTVVAGIERLVIAPSAALFICGYFYWLTENRKRQGHESKSQGALDNPKGSGNG